MDRPAFIPAEEKKRIYLILADEFGFGNDTPMATVAFSLMNAGVEKESYGYAKLKAFLADLGEFLSFTDIVAGGVPQRLVTIVKREEWEAERLKRNRAAADKDGERSSAVDITASASPEENCTIRQTQGAPARTLAPSKELERFAWLGPWDDLLESLADIALPEVWEFESASADPRRKSILRSYLSTTFYRLKLEDKVCIDEDAGFAAFNTGLVNGRYDDIYACFTPGTGQSAWRFAGFCTSGARGLGKRLVNLFNPLPEPASYFKCKDDLLFDLEKNLIIDFDHIVIDNIHRLPHSLLEDELRSNDEALRLLADTKPIGSDSERKASYAKLRELLEEEDRLFKRLRLRVSEAVEMARRRVRWNFRTAIPSYYPRMNAMSLLLPLCLVDELHADAALVVQLMASGNYQGQTILTMEQAYMNARLICRPDSDWLTTLPLREEN